VTAVAPHITEFLRVRLPLERNASPHTSSTYAYAFQLLFEFAGRRRKVRPSDLTVEQLDADLILAFLRDLETTRKNSIATRNARLAAIKSFFRFVEHRVPSALEHVRRVLAIPTKKATTGLVGYLTQDEAQAIVDAPPSTPMGLRDRAMLHLAIATGIRVSELVGLRVEDLTLRPRPCLLVHGKGRRQRLLPLWKETAAGIRRWLAVRRPFSETESILFLNARGLPMTRSGFAYVLAKYANLALKTSAPNLSKRTRVTPHVLRHTCAMVTLQATKDVRKVALWLGHSRLETTEMYLRADPTEKLEALAGKSPFRFRPGRFPASDDLMAVLAAVQQPQRSRP
jgi:integrase/recombinase XerD